MSGSSGIARGAYTGAQGDLGPSARGVYAKRMRAIVFLTLLAACASPQPLPPCPAPGPSDDELVRPAELELPADKRMPEGATPPELVASPEPVLPDNAFEGASGPQVVVVEYRIDETGNVASTEIRRGQPPFSETAVEAVMRMKFRPATHEGAAIAVYQVRRFVFRHSFAHCDDQPHSPGQ
jgi:TonB family protein